MESTSERKRQPTQNIYERPPCFGDPELVIPEDEKGVIEVPEECRRSCCLVKKCSKWALLARAKSRPPVEDDSAVSRVKGFFKRWSNHKLECSKSSDREDCK